MSIQEWLRSEKTGEVQRNIEQRIVEFLFSQSPNEFQNAVFQLAWIGSKSENRPLLEREIANLIRISDEWQILQAGGIKHVTKKFSSGCKQAWDTTCEAAEKVGTFVAEHKVEILVGVAICATGIGIAAATGYTLTVSVAGVAIAGAGSVIAAATEKAELPRIPQVPPPSSKDELALVQQPQFFNLPKLDLPNSMDEVLVTPDGIWANGVFYPTNDLIKQSHFESEFARYNTPQIPSTKEAGTFSGFNEAISIPSESKPAFQAEDYLQIKNSVAFVPKSKAKYLYSEIVEQRCYISIPFLVPGEKNTACNIGWINGINNTFEESIDSAVYIQKLSSGNTIQGIYNLTHNPVVDVLEAAILNHNGISPITGKLLQDQWTAFHEANLDRPNAKFLQICHSQGTIHVKNALERAPQEIQNRVIVIAVAPAAVVPKKLCFQSYNYASENDFVYKLEPSKPTIESISIDDVLVATFGDPIDYRDQLIILAPHPDAPSFDHPFQSPTFEGVLKEGLADYKQHNGEYLPEEKGKK